MSDFSNSINKNHQVSFFVECEIRKGRLHLIVLACTMTVHFLQVPVHKICGSNNEEDSEAIRYWFA